MEPACIKTTRHPGGVHGRDEFQEYRFQVSVTHPRLAAQLRQCAVGDQSAFGDDANPFGHTFRDFQYMGRHDNLRIALHLPNEDILHHSRRHSVLPGQQLVQKISFVFCTNTTANATFGRTLLEKPCQRSCALEPRRSLSISSRVRRARTSIPRAQRRIQDTQTARVFHKSPAPPTPRRPEILPPKGLATYRFKIPRWCPRPTTTIRQSSSTSWFCPRHWVRPALKLSRLNPQFQAIDGETIKTFPEILKSHRGGFFLSRVDITLLRYCSDTVNRRKFASTIIHGQEKL